MARIRNPLETPLPEKPLNQWSSKELAKVKSWIEILLEKEALEREHLEWQYRNPQPKPKTKPNWKPRGTKKQKETLDWLKEEERKQRERTIG